MGTAGKRQRLSKLFSAFTRAEAILEITPKKFKIQRLIRQARAKWLLRRAAWLFEKYRSSGREMTPLALIIGARISFHRGEYMEALQYCEEVRSRSIGVDQHAIVLMIRAECHEKMENSKKPSESYRIIFEDLYDKLEPINQIRVLRSRAGFEGRRRNLEKAEKDIARARRIAVKRKLVEELLKLKALEMSLFVEQ